MPPAAGRPALRAVNLRALRLADDNGATPQQRRNAYARARKELDGLIAGILER